jgi:hypothetical protein
MFVSHCSPASNHPFPQRGDTEVELEEEKKDELEEEPGQAYTGHPRLSTVPVG